MKKTRRILALALALIMSLSMSMAAFASEPPATAPTTGTITINSPIVGATYKVYKIFDETTNADVDAFSYTISEESDFYGAVVEYASNSDNGLILKRIKDSDPATYNVSVDEDKFDAQTFGKAMQAVLESGSPAVEADEAETAKPGTGIVAKAAGGAAISEDYEKVCTITTDDTSDQLVFDGTNGAGIPLGYYLVNPEYPAVSPVTVTMGEQSFTEADCVKNADGSVKIPRELTSDAQTKINTYATATVDDAYVEKYISDHGITTNEDGSPLNDAGKAAIKTALINSLKADAEEKILAALNNNPSEADHNVKEPILVFLDSSQPDAVINEKNELDKWDVPVNPTGDAPEGTPDHGEPEGGKNIVVSEDPQYFADWSEAEIGDSVHYQLRVNAMNFIRTGETDATIEQVKEYILADYQSAQMHFDESKGLNVSIWAGDNANDSQASTKTNVTSSAGLDGIANATYEAAGENENLTYPSINYTAYADTFFKNSSNKDGKASDFNTTDQSVFGDGTGIVLPWVIVSRDATLKSTYPVYTITNVPIEGEFVTEDLKTDANGQPIPVKKQNQAGEWITVDGQYVSVNNRIVNENGQVLDEEGNPIQATEPIYTYSIYNSDVTIVVDYWMILDDKAIVDEPGNKNFAQYGWNPVDNKDQQGNPQEPTNPDDDDKPSQKEEVDEATVYTFALAWVKIDEKGNELADAKFQLPFYIKKDVKDGKAYVYGVSNEEYEELSETDKAKYTNEVTTTVDEADGEKGVITIKGVKQGTYSITETEAPAGFNKLTAPFDVEAKKSGPAVTTKTKTTVYFDADGNVTDTVTTATEEYTTDEDSFNKEGATSPEETSVPVYQFDPIVNKQGTELPSTGGIGTTMFYVVGTILVIGAGILLVSRRRMNQ